ncbi:MAG: hypothetical protein HC800_01295 [Phormidesmis sp. RL_2_1]|nr:hypothetical protein [Phormidesmis sp. RL_2_1]
MFSVQALHKIQLFKIQKTAQSIQAYSVIRRLLVGTSLATALAVLPQALSPRSAQAQSAQAQSAQSTATPIAPTARYAQDEAVGLDEIIAEWRGYYADVPVYVCVCLDDTCDQTQQWPYREYYLYQLGVALGPNNGRIAEGSGANCFDIADGSRPTAPRAFSTDPASTTAQASPPPAAPVVPPSATPSPPAPEADSTVAASIPTATTINNGEAIRLDWPSGASNVVAVAGSAWTIDIVNAFDCESFSLVGQKTMTAQRVVGEPAVDETTGNVAIPVLLDSCADVDQSAVFVISPSESGSYGLYRTQLPGRSDLAAVSVTPPPTEFASYGFASIQAMNYWDGVLFVRQGTASGAESVLLFRPGLTPAGDYAGCGVVQVNEGADFLCPD